MDDAVSVAPAGSAVVVRAHDGPGTTACVVVEDAGPEIPAERLAAASRRFATPDSPRRQRIGGVGPGVAYCRAVVLAHGGRLDVESAPGRTVVTCELRGATPG